MNIGDAIAQDILAFIAWSLTLVVVTAAGVYAFFVDALTKQARENASVKRQLSAARGERDE
jgi:hypothetical protein